MLVTMPNAPKSAKNAWGTHEGPSYYLKGGTQGAYPMPKGDPSPPHSSPSQALLAREKIEAREVVHIDVREALLNPELMEKKVHIPRDA